MRLKGLGYRRSPPLLLPPELSEAAEPCSKRAGLSPLSLLSLVDCVSDQSPQRDERLVPSCDVSVLVSLEVVTTEGGASEKLRALSGAPAALVAAVGGMTGAGDARSASPRLVGEKVQTLSGADASQLASEADAKVDGVTLRGETLGAPSPR